MADSVHDYTITVQGMREKNATNMGNISWGAPGENRATNEKASFFKAHIASHTFRNAPHFGAFFSLSTKTQMHTRV